MHHAAVNGQQLAYEDSGGRGPVVLFSHGFLMDHRMFDPQVEALAGDYRCVRWDERCFGATKESGDDFTYWDSADDAVALLDHLEIEQAVLAGMSQGGFLSLRAALRHPDRVRALVLIDTQAATDDPETVEGQRGMVGAWTSDDEATRSAVADIVAGLIIGDPAESAIWKQRWLHEYDAQRIVAAADCLFGRDDISDRLGEITCPALVIHGTDDEAIPLDRARALCEGLPDCRGLVEVPGAAHAANLTHPEVVNPPLLEFLRSLD